MRFDWLGRTAALALIASVPARAETLQEALADAYANNPDLTSQRAAVRALDEGVALAASAGRPNISGTVGVNQSFDSIGGFDDDGRALTASANLNLPFYSGGRVKNGVRAADRRVEAGRQTLRAVENTILVGAVTAYLDTQRDAAVVDLNRNQVRVLQEQLRASRDRFEVGDLTRTDVAQSEARLATAQSNLTLAEAQLIASQENYRRVIGHPPGVLAPPPPLPPLPGTAEQSVDQAVANNPSLQAARLAERAAAYDVNVAEAGRLPTITGTTGVRYVNTLEGSGGGTTVIPGAGGGSTIVSNQTTDTSQTVGISATIPFFQGGAVSASIRQAQARRSQALEQIAVAERNVVASARNAYEGVVSSNAVIKSASVAVNANALALEGTRQENMVGSRTILDVLDAEQELLNTRVTLVRAKRDAYVAGYTLLSTIGRADAEDLGLPVTRYDPNVNYKHSRGIWSDWNDGPDPKPVATSTAKQGEAAQQPTTVETTTTVVTTTKK